MKSAAHLGSVDPVFVSRSLMRNTAHCRCHLVFVISDQLHFYTKFQLTEIFSEMEVMQVSIKPSGQDVLANMKRLLKFQVKCQ